MFVFGDDLPLRSSCTGRQASLSGSASATLLVSSRTPPTDKGKQRRELLEWPADVDPAADHWWSGSAWQTRMERVPVRGLLAAGRAGRGPGEEAVVDLLS